MIELNIPGSGTIELEHLVCDVNGTLAVDGNLLDGLPRILTGLRDRLVLHVLSADTQGRQEIIDRQLAISSVRIQTGEEAEQKAQYVRNLKGGVIAIGQGANDAGMLKEAVIGVCVLSREGADLVVPDIYSALELLDYPIRLVASLRK
jgi:soluble P-type ATPase